jgi:hypothetical protein
MVRRWDEPSVKEVWKVESVGEDEKSLPDDRPPCVAGREGGEMVSTRRGRRKEGMRGRRKVRGRGDGRERERSRMGKNGDCG